MSYSQTGGKKMPRRHSVHDSYQLLTSRRQVGLTAAKTLSIHITYVSIIKTNILDVLC